MAGLMSPRISNSAMSWSQTPAGDLGVRLCRLLCGHRAELVCRRLGRSELRWLTRERVIVLGYGPAGSASPSPTGERIENLRVSHVLSRFPQQGGPFSFVGHDGNAYVYRVNGLPA